MNNTLNDNLPYIYKNWTSDDENKYRWIWAEKAINTDKYSKIEKEAEEKMENVVSKLNRYNHKKNIVAYKYLSRLIVYYEKKEREFYSKIQLNVDLENPIRDLTNYFFADISSLHDNIKNKKGEEITEKDTIDFENIKTDYKTCFKLIIADRSFANLAQNFLSGSIFSRASYFKALKETRESVSGDILTQIQEIEKIKNSTKRKKKVAKIIGDNKELRTAIVEDLKIALTNSITNAEEKADFQSELDRLINLDKFETFKDELKKVGEKFNKTGRILEVKPKGGKEIYLTIGLQGEEGDITFDLEKTIKSFKNPKKLDLMGIGTYNIKNFYCGTSGALIYLRKNRDMIRKVAYLRGAKSGVSGFIGELLGFLNFNKSDTIKATHSGAKNDTVDLSNYLGEDASEEDRKKYESYKLGDSFADEKVEAGNLKFGINIKHYISRYNKNESIYVYKPDNVSLFDNQAVYRYFSKEDVFLMRFAYLNYSFYEKISGSTKKFDLAEDIKNYSVISIGNFIRLSSPEELNLFYQINNLIIPASIILKRLQALIAFNQIDYFEIDSEVFPKFPKIKKIDENLTLEQFEKEAEKNLLISQSPRKLTIKYKGLSINLSDLNLSYNKI